MSQREKLWVRMNGPEMGTITFKELKAFAEYLGFTVKDGSDAIFRHPLYPLNIMVGKPHGGRDRLRKHDIKAFREAVEYLIEKQIITELKLI